MNNYFDTYFTNNGRYTVIIDEREVIEEYATDNLYAAYKYNNMLREAGHNAFVVDNNGKVLNR